MVVFSAWSQKAGRFKLPVRRDGPAVGRGCTPALPCPALPCPALPAPCPRPARALPCLPCPRPPLHPSCCVRPSAQMLLGAAISMAGNFVYAFTMLADTWWFILIARWVGGVGRWVGWGGGARMIARWKVGGRDGCFVQLKGRVGRSA